MNVYGSILTRKPVIKLTDNPLKVVFGSSPVPDSRLIRQLTNIDIDKCAVSYLKETVPIS